MKFTQSQITQFLTSRKNIYYVILSGISYHLNFQTDNAGRPQHFAVQLIDGSVSVTTDIGTETISASLPLIPFQGMYSADVSVQVTSGLLILRLNPISCNDGPQCLVTVIHSGQGNFLL